MDTDFCGTPMWRQFAEAQAPDHQPDSPRPPDPLLAGRPESPARRRRRVADLARQITTLAGHLNAAQHRFLVLIAEFDDAEGWSGAAVQGCAHWLNWKCGIDLGAAREKLRVGHALAGLPLISAAMASGELSYSKVRALTRIATAAIEAELLMMARHGTAAHVERIVRGYRRASDAAELTREARQFESRSVRWFHDDVGALVLEARLPADSGDLLIKALELATADWWRKDVSAETSIAPGNEEVLAEKPTRTLGQSRADALVEIAETYLHHGQADLAGGQRQQIVVHVDSASLIERTPGRCEIENGPAIASETARRLACDASRITIIEDAEGRPLDVGRRTRTIPPAIGRALRSRDRGCRFPGCCNTRFIDAHHIHHWADGGATRLSNLVLLCRFHHRLVHEGQLSVMRLDDGALRFTNSNGEPFSSVSRTKGSVAALIADHGRLAPDITPETAITRWAGERLDLGLAVAGLMLRHERAHPP